mgnify:CR=1 FL=1
MLGEFDAVSPESVQMGRRGIAAVKGQVRPAEVVGDDEDDVGF